MSMIHLVTPRSPRYKKRTRRGRGEGSKGKTSGRGNKGAKARTGTYVKRGHEHGQTPIFRRFPKRGFSNHDFERRYYIVNLQDLERFAEGTTIDAVTLIEAGLVPNHKWPVKILGEGGLTKKLNIAVGWYSVTAKAKILELGGKATNLKGEPFEHPKPKKRFIKRDPVKKVAEAAPAAEVAAPAAAAPEAESK